MQHAVQHQGKGQSMELMPCGKAHALTWGIKESFRRYFERLPDHNYELTEGAGRSASGKFTFPPRAEAGPARAGHRMFSFSGRVLLTAHFGALSVMIADPEVLVRPDGRASLSAEVDKENGQTVRMVIANLALEGTGGPAGTPQICFSASLARDGQYLFMGNYYAGDPLDPVTIRPATA